MRVLVDTAKCEAHGDCVMAAPEVFDLDDDSGVVTLLMAEPPPELQPTVLQAVADCPVQALSVE